MLDLKRFFQNTSHQLLTDMEQQAQRFQAMPDPSVTKAPCNELVRQTHICHLLSYSSCSIIISSEWADPPGERDLECHHSINMWSSSDSSSQLGVQVCQ